MLPLLGLAPIILSAPQSPVGKTRTYTLSQLKGFRLWEGGPSALLQSSTLGNVRRTFTARFKNETREEIAQVDVQLRVRDRATGKTTYRSPIFRLRSFNNTAVPHVGSLLPFNKTAGESFTVDYPGRYWTTGVYDDIEIVSIHAYTGLQSLRDTGHLFTWMANTPDQEILARFAKEPALTKVRDASGLNATLISFAVSGTGVEKYILAHGGDLRSKTVGGSTIAHLAAFNTNPGVLDLVRLKGIPIDAPSRTGRTPLFKAIQLGNPISLRWLLAHGANPNRVDKEGRSAVYYALVDGQTQVFEALVAAGANPKYHDRFGYGWMHTAAVRNYLMLPYVLRAGGAVNDVDPKLGMTPLMAVARGGDYDSVEWLIQHGAKVDAKDRKGETAYDYARRANTLRTDRFFREAVEKAQH